jgi:hypothetical protein
VAVAAAAGKVEVEWFCYFSFIMTE